MFSDLDSLFDLNDDGQLDVFEQALEYEVVCGDFVDDDLSDSMIDSDADFLDNDFDF